MKHDYVHNYKKEIIVYTSKDEEDEAIKLGVKKLPTWVSGDTVRYGVLNAATFVDRKAALDHAAQYTGVTTVLVPWDAIRDRILGKPEEPLFEL